MKKNVKDKGYYKKNKEINHYNLWKKNKNLIQKMKEKRKDKSKWKEHKNNQIMNKEKNKENQTELINKR